ncbi:MAG: hypothetical protein FJZ01_10780 [Candidatus Sericytochromatia bacterium]|nr:hypothetical protein [Candidatus Tanganyikabacteria bacterium]
MKGGLRGYSAAVAQAAIRKALDLSPAFPLGEAEREFLATLQRGDLEFLTPDSPAAYRIASGHGGLAFILNPSDLIAKIDNLIARWQAEVERVRKGLENLAGDFTAFIKKVYFGTVGFLRGAFDGIKTGWLDDRDLLVLLKTNGQRILRDPAGAVSQAVESEFARFLGSIGLDLRAEFDRIARDPRAFFGEFREKTRAFLDLLTSLGDVLLDPDFYVAMADAVAEEIEDFSEYAAAIASEFADDTDIAAFGAATGGVVVGLAAGWVVYNWASPGKVVKLARTGKGLLEALKGIKLLKGADPARVVEDLGLKGAQRKLRKKAIQSFGEAQVVSASVLGILNLRADRVAKNDVYPRGPDYVAVDRASDPEARRFIFIEAKGGYCHLNRTRRCGQQMSLFWLDSCGRDGLSKAVKRASGSKRETFSMGLNFVEHMDFLRLERWLVCSVRSGGQKWRVKVHPILYASGDQREMARELAERGDAPVARARAEFDVDPPAKVHAAAAYDRPVETADPLVPFDFDDGFDPGLLGALGAPPMPAPGILFEVR